MKATIVYKEKVPVVEKVKNILEQKGFKTKVLQRDKIRRKIKADLIVPVGGDGTVLAAAPFALGAPILAVNAYPRKSVGFFCAVSVKELPKYLDDIKSGKKKTKSLPLLEAYIGTKKLSRVALNEYLLTSENPSHTCKYELKVNGVREKQRSSGIWVSAGPGSTAVIHKAGGKVMPINSDYIQFLVREPCPYPDEKYKLINNILKKKQSVLAISDMSNGMIYADARSPGFKWPRGKKVKIQISKERLKLFV